MCFNGINAFSEHVRDQSHRLGYLYSWNCQTSQPLLADLQRLGSQVGVVDVKLGAPNLESPYMPCLAALFGNWCVDVVQDYLPAAMHEAFLAITTEFVLLPWRHAMRSAMQGASQGGSQVLYGKVLLCSLTCA